MAIHKYIFFIDEEGIRTYKYRNKNDLEIFKYKGEVICAIKEFKAFYEWFTKAAAIAADDIIDLCFLSDQTLNIPIKENFIDATSSWKQDDILNFCENYIGEKNYKISLDEERQFVFQSGNIYDEKNIKNLYMKCFPDFSFQKPIEEVEEKHISLVNMYMMECLEKI